MLSLTIGPMYSGKTSALFKSFNANVSLDKLIIDYDIGDNVAHIVTHEGDVLPSYKLTKFDDFTPMQSYVYINEAQFFPDLLPFVIRLVRLHKHVEVYGLDGDFNQKRIGCIFDLIPLCDTIVKLNGTCKYCKSPSIHTKRLSDETDQIVFNADIYAPVCRNCIYNMTTLYEIMDNDIKECYNEEVYAYNTRHEF